MNIEGLECENLDVNELSDTEREQFAGKHHGSSMFAWAMIGALGAVLGATTVVVLLF